LKSRSYRRRAYRKEEEAADITSFLGVEREPVRARRAGEGEEAREERSTSIGISSGVYKIDPTFGIPCEICGRSATYMIRVGMEEHYFCDEDLEKGRKKYLH